MGVNKEADVGEDDAVCPVGVGSRNKGIKKEIMIRKSEKLMTKDRKHKNKTWNVEWKTK